MVAPRAERQHIGLSRGEAAALLAKLEDAQRRLNAGEFQAFALLAGSVASYPQATQSPRTVFLEVPFQNVWNIERIKSGDRFLRTFRLAYAPQGLGKPYWDIEVVLGGNDAIERVQMFYRPPAPS